MSEGDDIGRAINEIASALAEIRTRVAAARERDDRLLDSLRANVMARRNAPGGCCDWSCPLCVVLSEEE